MKPSPRLILINAYRLGGFGGGILATRAMTQALLDTGLPGVLVGAAEDQSHPAARRAAQYVAIPRAGNLRRAWSLLTGVAADRLSPRVDRWLRRELRPGDILVLNGGSIGRYANRSSRSVVIHHNIETDYAAAEFRRHPLRLLLVGIARRNQMTALCQARRNVFISAQDLHWGRAQAKPASQLCLAPAFVPEEASGLPLLENGLDFAAGMRLLITGSLDNAQIVDPFLAFARDVLPSLRRARPGLAVTLAGKNPSPALARECRLRGVTLAPNPESMEKLLAQATLYLAVTDRGSGIKYRLADPLRWGLPILAHQKSAAGWEGTECPWIKVYRTSEELAASFHTLASLGEIALAERKKIQGLFQARFSYQSLARPFAEACLAGLWEGAA